MAVEANFIVPGGIGGVGLCLLDARGMDVYAEDPQPGVALEGHQGQQSAAGADVEQRIAAYVGPGAQQHSVDTNLHGR